MSLAQEDIEYIKNHLGEWLAQTSLGKPPAVYEIELRERMVRVEEAIRHQSELMQQGFTRIDLQLTQQRDEFHKLLAQQREEMNKRFEQVDKRFEQVDKRFEQVDKRFEQVDKRFEQVDKRFEQIDKRFEQIDKRFDQVDKRFEEMLSRHDRQFLWLIGFMATCSGLVIAALRLL